MSEWGRLAGRLRIRHDEGRGMGESSRDGSVLSWLNIGKYSEGMSTLNCRGAPKE